MSGREAIIAQIISDARLRANTTSQEAGKKATETIAIAENDAKIYFKKHMQESYEEREEIIRRRLSAAQLESRKMYLETKQGILKEVFDETIASIKKDSSSYKKLAEKMIAQADDGDIVIVSEEDKKIFTSDFVKKAGEKAGKKVSISNEYGNFAGGIILCGKKTDKNMTLEVELETVRDLYEPEIVKLLFKE